VRALQPGFEEVHTKGSHCTMKRVTRESVQTVCVVLGKKEVARWTLKSILEQAEMSVEEFKKLL
jgi:predicted RNA binding protein YcfA (HicA-like mRNA interferase family)